MENLKNTILDALQNKDSLDNTFYSLSKSQENLLKNYSNPVFNNKDKNEILKNYTNLQNIGKSLFRYNALKENNFIDKANEEKSNIENSVLNGGISYNKYVWRSENSANTCALCKSLDGKIFESYEEVPARPHPNCRCRVEVLEEKNRVNSNYYTVQNKNPETQKTEKGNWVMPCNGYITSSYGMRTHPIYKTEIFHNGWDIGVPIGTPIIAIADGTVFYAGTADGYGKMVILNHGKINGIIVTSEYGHISSWTVKIGETVKAGQIIAISGNEGTSSGPHLHLTIREGAYKGKAEDPKKYININY